MFFYVVASSQVLTYVGNAALVTIQPQTLVYNGGGLQAAGTSVVNNSGNIMIKGVSTGATTDDLINIEATSNFNLKLATTSSYGQLYITGIPQGKISGKVNKEYLADYMNGTTGSQQMGLPFYNFRIPDLVEAFGDGNLNVTNTTNNSTGRFAPNSAFWWNNARARFDQIAYNGTAYYSTGTPNPAFISPMTYYILPRRKSDATYFWQFPKSDKKIFKGTPASDVIGGGINNVNFALSGAYSGSFGTNGNASNTFGEKYYSYLDDPFRNKGAGWPADYAKNLYQLANPFLTNIDLKYIGIDSETGSDDNFISKLEGVAYYGDNNVDWTAQNGTTYPGTILVMKTSNGAFQAGDVGNRIIKPMGAFMVKLADASTTPFLNFNKTRRFKQTSRADGIDYSVTAAKTSETTDDIPSDKIVKQVAVVMYDLNGMELDRTYYAVSPSAFTGYGPTSTTLQAYSDNKKIYTKEEKLAGGEDAAYTDKLYINEANEITFKTKEIPLYINYTDQPYQLKFELYEKGERVEDGLSNGNSFYIKDAQNQIIKIVDGESLSMNGAQTLGLYYEKPSNITLGTDSFTSSQTIIAKKDAQWVVRFAKDWKNATVEVYSSAGQLLNKQQNISTSYDYVVPLNYQAKSTFVIKATSENGEVVIKKILN